MQVKIEKEIYEGWGLGHDAAGKSVFVKKAVPGDVLDVMPTKDKKSYIEAKIIKIIEPGPSRIQPTCSHFEQCGGCEYQNFAYDDQLAIKSQIFKETLERAKINLTPEPILPGSDSEYFYRNIIRFFLQLDQDGRLYFAMHHHDYENGLVPIDKCFLLSEKSNEIMEIFSKFVNDNIEDKSGFWQLRIRHGKFTDQYMIEIITTSPQIPEEIGLANTLIRNFPQIDSIYHCFAPNKDLRQQKRRLISGSPVIYEKIDKFKFQISPESFFQTNSLGLKTLYNKIKEFSDVKIGENVLDLYCGTGTIGIYLSTLAKEVAGVEIVPEAIKDAIDNAKINNIKNCDFIGGDSHEYLRTANEMFDVIVVDPPRSGLSKDLINRLGFTKFGRLIYVSCNPATFARDINLLKDKGAVLQKVQPIDMFPQTHHIECIGLLEKK